MAACVLGTFLGLHLQVLVLIPVNLIGAALLGMIAAWAGQALSDGLVMIATNIILCQAGYMLGVTARAPLAQFSKG